MLLLRAVKCPLSSVQSMLTVDCFSAMPISMVAVDIKSNP